MFRQVDAALKLIGMTRGQLAKALDVNPGTLSLKLNGKSQITLREAQSIKTILETNLALEELFQDSA